MRTAAEILSAQGIIIKLRASGRHKTICPKCSAGRKHKRDPCLSVMIDELGVRWHCHNDGCRYQGGEFYDGDAKRGAYKMARGAGHRARGSDQIRTLHRAAKPGWARSRHPLPPGR